MADREGNRPATIKDVAREAGVSISSVSCALNGKPGVSNITRERVRGIALRLGYVPNSLARSMILKRTNIVGLVVPQIGTPFMTELIHQLELAAREAGLYILLGCSHGSSQGESDVLERFVKAHVDALIVAPGNDHTKATYQSSVALCRRYRKPFVFIASSFEGLRVSSVLADLRTGEKKITEYLIGRGHRRFAFVGGPATDYYSEIRFLGLQDAVQAAALSPDEVVRIDCVGRPTHEVGAAAVSDYLSHAGELPDAFVCVNDLVALGAYRALGDRGITVPDDVSLVGFDDVPLFVPVDMALTTVRIPVARMASDALCALQGRYGEVSRYVVDTELVEGCSVRDRNQMTAQ